MNRQGQRSGATGGHHNREYSEHYLDASSKWFNNSSSNLIPPIQDYNLYGGGGGSMYRSNAQRSFNEYCSDPATPPWSYAIKKNGNGNSYGDEDDSPHDFSPGLLDLHSFDTELLPQITSSNLYDFEPYIFGKQTVRARTSENNVSNSLAAADNVKSSNVAKIEVVYSVLEVVQLEWSLQPHYTTSLNYPSGGWRSYFEHV